MGEDEPLPILPPRRSPVPPGQPARSHGRVGLRVPVAESGGQTQPRVYQPPGGPVARHGGHPHGGVPLFVWSGTGLLV